MPHHSIRELLRVVDIVDEAAGLVFTDRPRPSRAGGYFSWVESGSQPAELVLEVRIGVPGEHGAIHAESALERARRLAAHADHVSSWESRDEAAGRFGGAIRTSDGVISFAGVSERADEAIALLTALRLGTLSTVEADRIVAASANDVYARLQRRLFSQGRWHAGRWR